MAMTESIHIDGEEIEIHINQDKNGREYFIPKRHVRLGLLDRWREAKGKRYLESGYLEDYRSFLLPEDERRHRLEKAGPTEFHITEVTHSTDLDGVKGILADQLFRGGSKRFGEQEVGFCWWEVKVGPEEAARGKREISGAVREYMNREWFRYVDKSEHSVAGDRGLYLDVFGLNYYKSVALPDLRNGDDPFLVMEKMMEMGRRSEAWLEDLLSQYTSSPPFRPGSRYGNFKFTLGLNELVEAYKRQFCAEESSFLAKKVEARALGTFFYRSEVVHAVVVYPGGDRQAQQLFKECAPLNLPDPGRPAQVSADAGQRAWKFTWRPDSTGGQTRALCGRETALGWWNSPLHHGYRHWDNAALAFYLPQGSPGFRVPAAQAAARLSACQGLEPNLSPRHFLEAAEAERQLRKLLEEREAREERQAQQQQAQQMTECLQAIKKTLKGFQADSKP